MIIDDSFDTVPFLQYLTQHLSGNVAKDVAVLDVVQRTLKELERTHFKKGYNKGYHEAMALASSDTPRVLTYVTNPNQEKN